MMNRIIIMGRITADLEMQQTNSGKEYINFSVAVDQPPRENGEKQTDFFHSLSHQSLSPLRMKNA